MPPKAAALAPGTAPGPPTDPCAGDTDADSEAMQTECSD